MSDSTNGVTAGGLDWKRIPSSSDHMEFHCPGCNQQALIKVSTVVETTHMRCGSTGLYSGWDDKDTEVMSTVYKCPWCNREMTEEEMYDNLTRVSHGGFSPHIRIKYKLYTDGDYVLRNHRMYGARHMHDSEEYDGEVCFDGGLMDAARKAVSFMWCMMCDGLHFSYTHPYLVREFYDMFKRLEDALWAWVKAREKDPSGHPCDQLRLEDYVSGNYDGTDFTITCVGYDTCGKDGAGDEGADG